MVQQNPLDSLFGSMGTNAMTGLGGVGGASLQSANSVNDLLQLAALLGGSQQQNVTFQPAQLLQVRQALAQQQATQVAAQQAEIKKRIEAEDTTRAAELVKVEHEKQKQKKKTKTQTRQNRMRMIPPHGDRRMDGHRVLGNAKLLQKPTLRSKMWKGSVTNSGRLSISWRLI